MPSDPPEAIPGKRWPPRESGTGDIGRQYSGDEVEFMFAVEEWKRANHDRFPSLSEMLAILIALGYRKVAEPGPMPGQRTMSQ